MGGEGRGGRGEGGKHAFPAFTLTAPTLPLAETISSTTNDLPLSLPQFPWFQVPNYHRKKDTCNKHFSAKEKFDRPALRSWSLIQ